MKAFIGRSVAIDLVSNSGKASRTGGLITRGEPAMWIRLQE